MGKVQITDRIFLDLEQQAEAFDLAMDNDPETLAYMAVFYRGLAQELADALDLLLNTTHCDVCVECGCTGAEDCPCDWECHDALDVAQCTARNALRKARGERDGD